MADPIRLSIQMTDSGGFKTSVPILLPSTATLAQIATTAVAFADALDDVSGCKPTGAFVSLPVDISGATVKASPEADSRITEGFNFVFSATGTSFTHGVRVPAVKAALVDGYEVLEEETEITTFTTLMTAGNSTDPDPTDDAGRDLASFLRSEFSKHKSPN